MRAQSEDFSHAGGTPTSAIHDNSVDSAALEVMNSTLPWRGSNPRTLSLSNRLPGLTVRRLNHSATVTPYFGGHIRLI